MMREYTISVRAGANKGEVFTVRAESIEVAATRFARKHLSAWVKRETGTAGMSGVFALYRRNWARADSSHTGTEIHVMP